MVGSEIIARYNRAKEAVLKAHAYPGGELGCYIRDRYLVIYDGCSVCHFHEKDVEITYRADCYDGPWHVSRCVGFDHCDARIDGIDPELDYVVEPYQSEADKFASGKLKLKTFTVGYWSTGGYRDMMPFDNFEKADRYARLLAKAKQSSIGSDSELRRYVPKDVSNDAQSAAERGHLRHYTVYDYRGHVSYVFISGR